MDTYEKKYNEALKWMRELYPGLHGATKEDAEHYFPELRESEDERIRKWLIDYFSSIKETVWIHRDITCGQILAWLEKQKEQIPYIDFVLKPHKGDDNNPYDMRVYDAQEYAIKRGFGIPFNDGEVYVDERHMTQTIGNILRWADEHPKEQKPAWSEEDQLNLNWVIAILNGEPCDLDIQLESLISWLKSLRPQPKKGLHPGSIRKVDNPMKWMEEDEKEKEQKPVECIVPPPSDPFMFNLHSIIYNFGKQIAAECLNTHILDTELDEYVTDANVDKYIKEHVSCLVKYHPLQKPAEWSEEDEKIIQSLILEFNKYVFFAGIEANKIIGFLKSLRPSWKPSEEQMKALEVAFRKDGDDNYRNAINSLYNDLKKL